MKIWVQKDINISDLFDDIMFDFFERDILENASIKEGDLAGNDIASIFDELAKEAHSRALKDK